MKKVVVVVGLVQYEYGGEGNDEDKNTRENFWESIHIHPAGIQRKKIRVSLLLVLACMGGYRGFSFHIKECGREGYMPKSE